MPFNAAANIPKLASVQINFDSQDKIWKLQFSCQNLEFAPLCEWFEAQYLGKSVHDFLTLKLVPNGFDQWSFLQLYELIGKAYRDYNGTPPFEPCVCPCLGLKETTLSTLLGSFQARVHGDALTYLQRESAVGTLCDLCHPHLKKLISETKKRAHTYGDKSNFSWMQKIYALAHPKDTIIDFEAGVLYVRSERSLEDIQMTYQSLDFDIEKI